MSEKKKSRSGGRVAYTGKRWTGKMLKEFRGKNKLHQFDIARKTGVCSDSLSVSEKLDRPLHPMLCNQLNLIEKHGINFIVISHEELMIFHQFAERVKKILHKVDVVDRNILNYCIDRFMESFENGRLED